MAPPHDLDVVILHFESDQVVFVNMGALFLCPAAQQPLDLTRILDEADVSPYALMPLERAAHLLALIEADTATENLFAAMPENEIYAAR
jgi:hypothetical protein